MDGTKNRTSIGKGTRCWFRVIAGERFGPFSLMELEGMCRRGEISMAENVVRQRSNGEWTSMEIQVLLGGATQVPQTGTGHKTGASRSSSSRTRADLPRERTSRRETRWLESVSRRWPDAFRRLEGARANLTERWEEIRPELEERLAPVRSWWKNERRNAAPLEKKWRETMAPFLSEHRLPLLAAVAALVVATLLVVVVSQTRDRRAANRSPRARPAAPSAVQPAPGNGAEEGPKGKATALSGCPRIVANGADLARASTEGITLTRVFLEEAATQCSPCALRARLPDGTPLALEVKNPAVLQGARAGATINVCGKIVTRTARTWIRVERVGP